MEGITKENLKLGHTNRKDFDVATLFGILAAFGLVVIAIALGGGALSFFNVKAVLIVIGGTIGATLVNYPIEDFVKTSRVVRAALFPDRSSSSKRIKTILRLSRKIRASGGSMLAAEDEVYRLDHGFFRKGLELLIDDSQPQEIRRILDIELSVLEERHRKGASLFQTMGNVAPAMGLIGTLIGLVHMLQSLNSPQDIGPAMAVALLTTFYGAILAHIVCLPIAGKLRSRSEEELLYKQMTIEGVVALAENASPQMIEQRLLSFLPPEERLSEYNG